MSAPVQDFSAVIAQLNQALDAIDAQITSVEDAAADQAAACEGHIAQLQAGIASIEAQCAAAAASAANAISQLEAYRATVEAQIALYESF